MATHSSILAWRISWTEEPGRLFPWGHQESDTTQGLNNNTSQQVMFKCVLLPGIMLSAFPEYGMYSLQLVLEDETKYTPTLPGVTAEGSVVHRGCGGGVKENQG